MHKLERVKLKNTNLVLANIIMAYLYCRPHRWYDIYISFLRINTEFLIVTFVLIKTINHLLLVSLSLFIIGLSFTALLCS